MVDEPSEAGPPPPADGLNEQELSGLRNAIDTLSRRVQVLEERERLEVSDPSVADFLSTMNGSPAIVVDEGVARATPCTAIRLPSGKELTYTKGAIGPLDEKQRALFCVETVHKEPSPAQLARYQAFTDAADTCKAQTAGLAKGEKLEPWLACMSREARTRGVEL